MMTLVEHKKLLSDYRGEGDRFVGDFTLAKHYLDAVAALENLAIKAREVLMMPENSTLRENAEDECWQALKELGVKP